MFAALNSFLTRAVTGYFLNKSLRFRSSASAYLNRTPAVAGNRTVWTWSGWVKRGTLGINQEFFSAGLLGANTSDIFFDVNDKLNVINYVGAVYKTNKISNAVFRDPAAWYHIVISANGATSVDVSVNGVALTWGTSVGPDGTNWFFNATNAHVLGTYVAVSAYYFDGEMAEINFVDGQALAPTAFGASSIYNQWLPIKYAGTYGTNGFYLPFSGGTATSYAGSFNGSNQYLAFPNDAAFSFGSSNFTIESWINVTSTSNYNIYVNSDTSNNLGVTLYAGGGTIHVFVTASPGGNIVYDLQGPASSVVTGVWTHVAFVRSGTTFTAYVNGVAGTPSTNSNAMPPSQARCFIGTAFNFSTGFFSGYISNYRVVNGTAVYTANFVPPTAALTAITNTSLLTLQNATIVDNSTNAFTITNNGTVVTSVQSPFLNPTVLTADSSGNGNNWTPNNISLTAGSTYDSLTDVPTLTSETVANYCVMNPLDKDTARGTISDANLKFAATAFSTYNAEACRATMGVTTGKWYYEFRGVTQAGIGNSALTNFTTSTQNLTAVSAFGGTLTNYIGANANIPGNSLQFQSSGYSASLANSTLFASYASGDVVNIAVDFTAGKIWVGKNGTYYNSGSPGAGTNATSTFTAPVGYNLPEFEVTTSSDNSNQSSLTVNFGQQPFVYTAPSGFLPLNTFNI